MSEKFDFTKIKDRNKDGNFSEEGESNIIEEARRMEMKVEKFVAEKDKEISKKEIRENKEELVSINEVSGIQKGSENLFLRKSVLNKIKIIKEELEGIGLGIKIFDAWRSPEEQNKVWEEQVEKIKNKGLLLNDEEIKKIAARFVAPPEMAPHCTGGSLDLTIYNLATGEELNMGTVYDDFEKESYTDHPSVSEIAKNNRRRLKTIMKKQGFTNFPTEWWHFSYGNTEWAALKGESYAIYGNIDLHI